VWEFWLLATLIVIGFGVAIYMVIWKHGVRPVAQRTKAPRVILHQHTANSVDVEALAAAVAKTVTETLSKNLLDKLDKLQYSGGGKKLSQEELEIAINESIIPVSVEATVDHMNLEGMAKEETHQDNSLEASKAKLATLLKKKENK